MNAKQLKEHEAEEAIARHSAECADERPSRAYIIWVVEIDDIDLVVLYSQEKARYWAEKGYVVSGPYRLCDERTLDIVR